MRGRIVVLLGMVCGATALTLGPVALGAGAAMPDRRQSSVSDRASDQVETSGSPFSGVLTKDAWYCVKDRRRDFNFYNAEEPGLKKPSIDIVEVCAKKITPGPETLAAVEEQFSCGETACSPGQPAIPAGPLLFVVMKFDGNVQTFEVPGVATRYTVAGVLKGDPSTKGTATEEAPNVYNDGLNAVLGELDFGVPPGSGTQVFAEDRRQELFDADGFPLAPVDTTSRFHLYGQYITAVISLVAFSGLEGIRVADTSGVQGAGGDAAQNGSDVAPGGKNAPFGTFLFKCFASLDERRLIAYHAQGKCKKVFLGDFATLNP